MTQHLVRCRVCDKPLSVEVSHLAKIPTTGKTAVVVTGTLIVAAISEGWQVKSESAILGAATVLALYYECPGCSE